MINAVSNNALIAALFGPGAVRPSRYNSVGRVGQTFDTQRADRAANSPKPVDSVEISSVGRSAAASFGSEPSDAEAQETRKLKQRDTEVRRHEQAHKAVAGGYAAGGPTFEYTTGPDGRRYAVGGEVNIDTSEVSGNPQATVAKMQQIRRAALAPAQPSSQDRAVAAQAAATERKARTELAQERNADVASAGQGGSPSQTSAPDRNSPGNATGSLLDLTI